MSYGLHDFLGNVGVLLVLLTYLMVQMDRMRATGISYQLANAFGAILILVSLANDFNLSAAIIEASWLLISIFGMVRHLRQRA